MTALANVSTQQLDDARRVLRVLTAAFPTYPVADDTAELYLAVIASDMPDFATAMRVVTDWATSQLLFPKPVELVEQYLAEAGRAQRRANQARNAQRHHVDGLFACPACEDVGMVFTKLVRGDRLYEAAMPCERCRPGERAYWREGHYDLDHDVWACEHPRCEARSKSRKRGHR